MDPNSGRLYTPDEMEALSAEARAELIELRGAVTQEKAERISRAVAEFAAREQAADEKRLGIIGKYRVERVNDPDGKHADCWYFVLDPTHDPIAREALMTYATEAREHGYQALYDDILDRLAVLP